MASATRPPGLEDVALRQAVEELLSSPALGRSEQLRQVLRYVCTEEMEGRGLELTEYAIGVQALGRPVDFSPETDSTVRTRAYELRKRLEEHYRGEGKSAAIRIELPKGSYRPRFHRLAVAGSVPEEPKPAPVAATQTWFWPGMAAGVALAGLVYAAAGLPVWKSEGERAIANAWGPLLTPGAAVTVVLANPPQLWVRDSGPHPPPKSDPSLRLPAPDDPVFLDWYRRLNRSDATNLFLHPNAHSPLWGDAAAAVAAARFLAARGVEAELVGEQNIRPAVLKQRNAIVIGREDYSPAVAEFQPPGGYAVRYVPEDREVGVADTKPGAGRALYRDRGGRVSYGLVTVLAWKGGGARPYRTIMFSGINSDGSHAGMDFLTSPEQMTALAKGFRSAGRSGWPASFQVVVRTRSADTYTIQSEFVALRVLE